MPVSGTLCLNIAIRRLDALEANRYAIWVTKAPYPSGYVLHDRAWPDTLSQTWHAWQEMFSLRGLPQVPHLSAAPPTPPTPPVLPPDSNALPYGARLMQHLGVSLWQWLFDGPIEANFNRSQGAAFGLSGRLQLRLEIQAPELIALPWEIMQSQMGKPAIALNSEHLLFSRTSSDVEPLPPLRLERSLKILLVLGQETETLSDPAVANAAPRTASPALDLEQEAEALVQILTKYEASGFRGGSIPDLPQVDTLIQPTSAELIERLEAGNYNIFFYAGHGTPAPDGGRLLLSPGTTLSGTELAQVLTRRGVILAVFNACWGAQPDHANQEPIPRSSLAEVLIHHGVPAVLGMRDSITDEEALSFIQALAQALRERQPVDRAVALARQHLLMLYKFNQPAWTLPVLYMHPQFDGQLIKPEENTIMPLPGPSDIPARIPMASLRRVGPPAKKWPIREGRIRVGSKEDEDNDLVLPEPGVSRYHAEIFYRDASNDANGQPSYFLKDFSRYGTLILGENGWQKIHQQEVSLNSGVQLKFGNPKGQAVEFVVEHEPPTLGDH